MDRVAVIIVAGGSGTRLGATIPKQFLQINGCPILLRTFERFAKALPNAEIIVVLPKEERWRWEEIIAKYGVEREHKLCNGGDSRFMSVKNALQLVDDSCSLVTVHDGVRPLVSEELIKLTVEVAQKHKTAIPAVEPVDSFRIIGEGGESKIFDRDRLKAIQTPQVFDKNLIIASYNVSYNQLFTDDASVVEHYWTQQNCPKSVTLCRGENSNIKITTEEDLIIAEALLTKLYDNNI